MARRNDHSNSTFEISFNLVKYIVQLSKYGATLEIYHATQEGCIFFENM